MAEESSQDPTQTGELGPMPTAQTEPGETPPGGPDAVPDPDEVIVADLDPDKNPATDDSPVDVKDSLKEAEDTDTAATRAGGADGSGGTDAAETPA